MQVMVGLGVGFAVGAFVGCGGVGLVVGYVIKESNQYESTDTYKNLECVWKTKGEISYLFSWPPCGSLRRT